MDVKENDIVIIDATGDRSDANVVDKMICIIAREDYYGDKDYVSVQPINNGDIQNFHSRAGRSSHPWVIRKEYIKPYKEGDVFV